MVSAVIIDGTASNGIGKALANEMKLQLINIEAKDLPDGESYVRIPKAISNKIAVIVQSLYPPQNKHIVELLLIIDAVKSLNPNKIVLIIPYLAYARQNKRFMTGEPASIQLLLRLFKCAGAHALITIDPHKPKSLTMFKGKVLAIEPIRLFSDALSAYKGKAVILAPDVGALSKAKALASLMENKFTFLEKDRDKKTGMISLKAGQNFNFEKLPVIIIDDVISTGSTVIQATRFAKSHDASKVIVVASHLIMAGNCFKRMKTAGISKIIGTNTIPNSKALVQDVSKLIAENLKTILDSL